MKRFMIDLETLGTGPNACLLQIGACRFNLRGEITEEVSIEIDPNTSIISGGVMDTGAVEFWIRQPKEVVDKVWSQKETRVTEWAALDMMNSFLLGADEIWSHATFDWVILQNAYKRHRMTPSFHYRSCRDLRTLTSLANIKTIDFTREGMHHNALDDAKFQVKYAVAAINSLKGTKQ